MPESFPSRCPSSNLTDIVLYEDELFGFDLFAKINLLIYSFTHTKRTSMTRSIFGELFYVNGGKERNGIDLITGLVTINGGGAVQSQERHLKGTLGRKRKPCQRQERGGKGNEPCT